MQISYAQRVQKLEEEGLTTSDAQAVIEAEDFQKRFPSKTGPDWPSVEAINEAEQS